MDKNNFRVIEGGLKEKPRLKYRYIGGTSTDTRLMGVIVLKLFWEVEGDPEGRDALTQLFYLDAEEFGLDTYESSFINRNDAEAASSEAARMVYRYHEMASCLGGGETRITEREARALVYHYYKFSVENDVILPDNIGEADFVLETETGLNPTEIEELYRKICTPIKNNYELINYFLMRVVGKDFEPARYLSSDLSEINQFEECEAATLLKNKITEISPARTDNILKGEDGESFKTKRTYLTESLIDDDIYLHILVSEIEVLDHKVVSFKKKSCFGVSEREGEFILRKSEFVDYIKFGGELKLLNTPLMIRNQRTEHPNGVIFMLFREDNKHVREQVFEISKDIIGFYLITKSNEFFMVSETSEGIKMLEKDILGEGLFEEILCTERYEFTSPIVYEYADSYFDDFKSFLDEIERTRG